MSQKRHRTGCIYPESGGQSGGRSALDISHKRDFLDIWVLEIPRPSHPSRLVLKPNMAL